MLVGMFGNFPAARQRGKFDTPNNSAYFSLGECHAQQE